MTKDVPAYSIVGGIPVKEVRKRFIVVEIARLQRLKWWDRPPYLTRGELDKLLASNQQKV